LDLLGSIICLFAKLCRDSVCDVLSAVLKLCLSQLIAKISSRSLENANATVLSDEPSMTVYKSIVSMQNFYLNNHHVDPKTIKNRADMVVCQSVSYVSSVSAFREELFSFVSHPLIRAYIINKESILIHTASLSESPSSESELIKKLTELTYENYTQHHEECVKNLFNVMFHYFSLEKFSTQLSPVLARSPYLKNIVSYLKGVLKDARPLAHKNERLTKNVEALRKVVAQFDSP